MKKFIICALLSSLAFSAQAFNLGEKLFPKRQAPAPVEMSRIATPEQIVDQLVIAIPTNSNDEAVQSTKPETIHYDLIQAAFVNTNNKPILTTAEIFGQIKDEDLEDATLDSNLTLSTTKNLGSALPNTNSTATDFNTAKMIKPTTVRAAYDKLLDNDKLTAEQRSLATSLKTLNIGWISTSPQQFMPFYMKPAN